MPGWAMAPRTTAARWDIVHDLRELYAADPYAYAVIAHLYECGCRSDGELA